MNYQAQMKEKKKKSALFYSSIIKYSKTGCSCCGVVVRAILLQSQ